MNKINIILLFLIFLLFSPPSSLGKPYAVSDPIKLDIPPLHPPRLDISFRNEDFSEPSGNKILDARESANLTFKVHNKGRGNAYDVTLDLIQLEGPNKLHYKKSISMGNLKTRQHAKGTFSITANRDISSGKAKFRVRCLEKNGFDAEPIDVVFQIQEFLKPQLTIQQIRLDPGNSQMIDLGEEIGLSFWVANTGKGLAEFVSIKVLPEDEDVRMLSNPREIPELRPYETKEFKFSFLIPKSNLDKKTVRLNVKLAEKRAGDTFSKTLEYGVKRLVPVTQEIEGKSTEKKEEPILKKLSVVDQFILDQKPVPPDKHKWAIVVGIEFYGRIDQPARFALRDALAVKEYLIRLLGVPEGHIFHLWDDTATLSDLKVHLEDTLKGRVGRDDIVYFYFAGHGTPDVKERSPHLLPWNGYPNSVNITGYPLSKLYSALSDLPASRVFAFIDTCYSSLDLGTRIIIPKSKIPCPKGKNVTILSAANKDQVSNVFQEERHGMFTYYFLEGLSGKADSNKDKTLTLAELYRYVKEKVHYRSRLISTSRVQTPQLEFSGQETPDWVLIKNIATSEN